MVRALDFHSRNPGSKEPRVSKVESTFHTFAGDQMSARNSGKFGDESKPTPHSCSEPLRELKTIQSGAIKLFLKKDH